MRIKTVYVSPMSENCYVVESDKAVVFIDPGAFTREIREMAEGVGNREALILITHFHFDHILGVEPLSRMLGCRVAIGAFDAAGLTDDSLNLCRMVGLGPNLKGADILLSDGDEISCGDLEFKVMHTPGHTAGSVCYLIEDALFSGDTLFSYDVGRTDFPTGSSEKLAASMLKLEKLEDATRVFSGHGEATTIGREKQNNTFLRRACGI